VVADGGHWEERVGDARHFSTVVAVPDLKEKGEEREREKKEILFDLCHNKHRQEKYWGVKRRHW
jgi:hypothetical protein